MGGSQWAVRARAVVSKGGGARAVRARAVGGGQWAVVSKGGKGEGKGKGKGGGQ